LFRWEESRQQKDEPPGSHLIRRDDDGTVGKDGIGLLLLRLLLQIMPPAVPFWAQCIKPFCMVAQECSDQHQEEEAMFLVANIANNGATFFPPDTPSTLSCHDVWGLKSRADTSSAANSLFLELGVHRKYVGWKMNDRLVRTLHVRGFGGFWMYP
jgi:hypothetical protein